MSLWSIERIQIWGEKKRRDREVRHVWLINVRWDHGRSKREREAHNHNHKKERYPSKNNRGGAIAIGSVFLISSLIHSIFRLLACFLFYPLCSFFLQSRAQEKWKQTAFICLIGLIRLFSFVFQIGVYSYKHARCTIGWLDCRHLLV